MRARAAESDHLGMAAASSDSPGAGFRRLLQDCATMGRLTAADPACPRRRIEDTLGSELATRLVGALARRAERPASVV